MDCVVTCPMALWKEWLEEGDAAGEEESGTEYYFSIGHRSPNVDVGDRVYIVAHGKLRGYAPLVRLKCTHYGYFLVRKGNAVSCTLPTPIKGFRGYRYRWWQTEEEIPSPNWRNP